MKVPFDPNTGDLKSGRWASPSEWRDNYEFDGAIKFLEMYTSGRSKRFVFEVTPIGTKSSFKAYMFPIELAKMLNKAPSLSSNPLSVLGRWTFCKRGKRFSLRWVDLYPKKCPYCKKTTSWEQTRFYHSSCITESCLKCSQCGALVSIDGTKFKSAKDLK